MERCHHKPRITKSHQELEETMEDSLPQLPEEAQPYPHLGSRLVASSTQGI